MATLRATDTRFDVNLFVPEKHALTEMEPPTTVNPKPAYARITAPWLALILKIVDVLRAIAVRTTGGPPLVVVAVDGRLRPVAYDLARQPYDPVAFGAVGGMVAVAESDVTTWAWAALGRLATLAWWLDVQIVTGAPTELLIALPTGARAAESIRVLCEVLVDGHPTVGVAWVERDGDTLHLARLDEVPFVAGPVTLRGEMVLAVEG